LENTDKCPVCGGDMKLEMHTDISYRQCSADPTHRMSLTEYSDLAHNIQTLEEIKKTMEKRVVILQVQLNA
tara:strand:- start:68551 stop:68763 length:213 start_codon:yes stop_codon:yes gene_type:complete